MLERVWRKPMDAVVMFNRDEVVAYNNTAFANMNAMAGEALYSKWVPMEAQPLTDRATLRIGGPQDPDNLNPPAPKSEPAGPDLGPGRKWMRLYYDRLVRLSPDVGPVPWAASKVTPIEDLTIDVTLREGMAFHDGEPLTTEDVVFTFEYYMNSDYSYFDNYLAAIDTVEQTGDLSLRFSVSEPSAPFATITLSQIPILPQHLWEDIEDPGGLTRDEIFTVASGPFVFDRYDRAEFMPITTFEDHFHADEIATDAVEFLIYADAEGVFTALQTDQIDMTAWRLEPGQIPLAEAEDDLTVISVPDFGYYHMTFNTRREPFDDRDVRRALTMAMERERMVNVRLDGRGEVGTSIIAPVNAFWHTPFIERFDFDTDAARAELEGAGYSWDADGRLQR